MKSFKISFKILIFLRKATLSVAFLCMVILPQLSIASDDSLQEPKAKLRESDLKSEVENLLINSNRKEAIKKIDLAMEQMSSDRLNFWQKRRSTILQLFLTEKAQKEFEQGNSLYPKETDLALTKFKNVEKREPMNTKVKEAIIRSQLKLGKCSGALQVSEKATEMDPFRTELKQLKMTSLVCAKKSKEALAHYELYKTDKKFVDSPVVIASLVELFLEKDAVDEARLQLSRCFEKDVSYPKCYFWSWKLDKEVEGGLSQAQKYLSICKNSEGKVLKRYPNDPFVCQKSKELRSYVEDKIPSTGKESI